MNEQSLASFLLIGWYALPAVIGNMSPVVIKRSFSLLDKPVSTAQFGSHKTWRGIVVATVFGGLTYILQIAALNKDNFTILPWFAGFIIGLAAIMGDLLKSYVKRRLNIAPGSMWFPFDQIDFMLPTLLILYLWLNLSFILCIYALLLTIGLHLLVNAVAYSIGLKEHPW